MSNAPLLPRLAADPLRAALLDAPAVLIHGPRQCGKSTLAQAVGEPLGYAYLTFDDDAVRRSALADPIGFAERLPGRCILDEIQRVPDLFRTLKRVIDRDRTAGRFVLAGSTNILLLPELADSLAGRLEIIRLHPLAQVEQRRTTTSFLSQLFDGTMPTSSQPRLGDHLAELIVAGGYPAALQRGSAARRARWYRDYVQAIVDRDVRELAQIRALDAVPRLLSLAAGQTARLLNVSDLAAPFQVSRPTIRDYVTLLARVFLLEELPPWHSNRLSRLIKTPKLHLGDTGVACALLGVTADDLRADRPLLGQLLETFVVQELRRLASATDSALTFHHFRDRDGVEVDLVIERGARAIAAIEVKAAATVSEADFRGLRKLQNAVGTGFRCGVVLYDGEHALSFGDRLYAVPLRALWTS